MSLTLNSGQFDPLQQSYSEKSGIPCFWAHLISWTFDFVSLKFDLFAVGGSQASRAWSAVFGWASMSQHEKGDSVKLPPDAVTIARFENVIMPHLDAAHNLAVFLCRDADAAQDIVQDAYFRAFRSFAEFRGGSGRAFILAIVRNCHLNWRKSRLASKTVPMENDDLEAQEFELNLKPFEAQQLTQEGDDPESALLRRMEAAAVRATLEELPEVYREVLVLRDLEDCSYKEISEVLGVPVGTVMSRLARARKVFQAAWRRELMQHETTP